MGRAITTRRLPRNTYINKDFVIFGSERADMCTRKVLHDARVAAQLSQEALAARMGHAQAFVQYLELGKRRMRRIDFCKVARALGLDPAILFSRVMSEMQHSLEIQR